jgi:hypothetical protein
MQTPIRGCASTAEQRIALIDPKTATFGVGSRTSHVLLTQQRRNIPR